MATPRSSRVMNTFRTFFGITLTALIFSALAVAQTASIRGTVTDTSGAVVVGAEVAAHNLDTNSTRTVTSGDAGAFTITNLPAGRYDITVNKTGFRVFAVRQVVLTVDQSLTANARLEAGGASEEVQVLGTDLPPVDLDTAQVSNIVESRQMQDLPLITRDPYSLVLLSPGTSQTNTGLGGFTINGSRERNNNFLLDGVDNNDTSVPGIADGVLSANPDSTEEFRVITNNFNAEYGRNTGAIIDVITKSGTNTFHGGVYEFGRWNSFGGARDWFNPRLNADGSTNSMNPYIRNQFGYTIGGPIIKNKTFFFFNEEFDRFRTTLTNASQVPTPEFKTGIFNYTSGGVTTPVDITQAGANNGTSTILQQFGGGALPPAPEDPTMQKVLALYPNPTFSNGDGISGTLLFPSSSAQSSYATVAKIDHHFTDRETISLRYGYDHSFDPNPFHDDILPGNVGGVSSKSINQGLSAHLDSTLSNSLINSFAFGWNKVYAKFGCTGIATLDSPVTVDQFGNGWDFYPGSPFTDLGCTALISDGQFRKTGTTSYGDALTWVRGTHTLKFGFDFRDIAESGENGFDSRRQVTFQPLTLFGVSVVQGVANDTAALENAAAAYYGLVSEDINAEYFNKSATRQATDNKNFRQHEYDWFGQDSWKMRRNLTLTFGLRYQFDGVPYEEGANLSNLLANPGSFQPGQDVVLSIVGPGTGKRLYQPDYSNIEPRFGFSWDPWGDGKTAVRGAFGIFHDRVFGNLFGNARGNPPFEQDYQQFPLDTINGFYAGGINGPFPLPAVPPTTPSAVIPDGSTLSPVLFDTHFRNTVSNNWSFGIQRELAGSNVLEFAYIGSEGHHIDREMDGNPPDPNVVNQLVAFCSAPNSFNCTPDTVTKNNLYFGGDQGHLPFNAVTNNALFQPFYQVSNGNSIYNSLQAKITHRMSHGLQIQGSYTWAHGIDDSNDPLVEAQGNRGFPRNSRDLAEERGNSDYDVRHVAVINYIWDVPFGTGKGFLNRGVLGKIFEGWQFSGITSAQTGHPFDVFTTTDMERTGLSGRADLVGNPFTPGANTPSSAGGNKIWFTNPTAFSDRCDPANPAPNGATCPLFVGAGSVGRNHFYGPHFVDFDLSWQKNTKITERVSAVLRVEGFNIFNHPHFNNPGNDLSGNLVESPIFGLITSTASRPDGTTSARQLQVALKILF